MNKIFWGTVIVVGFLIVLTLRITAQNGVETGTVYVMTNQVENAVMVFTRTANGSLQQAGTFPTGGAGNPIPMGMDPPTDPLASQGSLVLSGDLLFAVNAGSNEIS